MLPYGRQSIGPEDFAALADVLRSDWLTTGPLVSEFESVVASVSAADDPVECVSATSGTAALHMAYAGLGVGPGDEVVTTPMTFVATQATAARLGATIVFADVEEDTALLDPDAVEAAATSRTKVIAAVDYAGHPCEYDALRTVAERRGAWLLDDAAHAIGSTYKGSPVGSLADVTTYSFFPTKTVTTGEGGAVVTPDAALAERVRRFHAQGLVRDPGLLRHGDEGPWHQEVHEFGLNYRLADVLCALGVSQLRRLPAFKQRRCEITARYNHGLADLDGVRTPPQRAYVDPAWHLYPLRVLDGRRREVYEGLRARGIGVQVNYLPAYWHPVFEDLGYRRGMCPKAEAFYAEEISLPLFPGLTDADVDHVVDAVRGILGR